MGLWEGDGHRSPSLCIVLPESALLAESVQTGIRPWMGRTHLSQSRRETQENQSGTGMTLERQRGPPPLCKNRSQIWDTVWRFNIHSPAWASVSTENRPQGSVFPEREPPLKENKLVLDKGKYGAQACPGCATMNLLDGLCGTQPNNCPSWLLIWYPPRTGRKYIKARKTALSSRQFICQERNSSVHSPARRSAFEDGAPACHWCVRRDHMAMVDRTHSHPAPEKKRGLATVKWVDRNCATPDKASCWYSGV